MMAEDEVTSLTQINGAVSYCSYHNRFETDWHCIPLGKRFLSSFKGSRYVTNIQDIPNYKWKYLNEEKYEVTLDKNMAQKAFGCIDRMLQVSK